MSREVIKVLQGVKGRIFLYLPVYMAIDRMNKKQGKVEFKVSVEADSDERAVERLLDPSTAGAANEHFAVCDPLAVFEHIPSTAADKVSLLHEYCGQLYLLGGLIQKATFWVISRRYRDLSDEEDVARTFSTIFCYPEGSTGHMLAKRLQRLNSAIDIKTKNYGQELNELFAEGVMAAAAITADAAAIAKKKAAKVETLRVQEAYRYFDEPRFSLALTTGLLVRRSFLEDNRELVKDFVGEIQRSVDLIRCVLPSAPSGPAWEFAKKAFSGKEEMTSFPYVSPEATVSEEELVSSFALVHEYFLYPPLLYVHRGSWQNAFSIWEEKVHSGIGEDAAREAFNTLQYNRLISEIHAERVSRDLREGSRWDTFIGEKIFPWIFGDRVLSQSCSLVLLALAIMGFVLRDVNIPAFQGKIRSIAVAALVVFVFCAGMNVMNALGIQLNRQQKRAWQAAEYLAPAFASVIVMILTGLFNEVSPEQILAVIFGAGRVYDWFKKNLGRA